MPLVNFKDPILYKPTRDFNFHQDDPTTILDEMKRVMIEKRGVGLAANQVGFDVSVFIIGNIYEPDSIKPFFNPKITFFSEEKELKEEGCLSYPGLHIGMTRSKAIRLAYLNANGELEQSPAEGLASRVIQHEISHLEGKPFFLGASRLRIERAIKSADKKGFKYSFSDLYQLLTVEKDERISHQG